MAILAMLGACLTSAAADKPDPIETIQVESSRVAVRKQIQTFVTQVTRREGELIGRWSNRICPMVAGLSDPQNEFVRRRLIDVEGKTRKRPAHYDRKCRSNLFVVFTDEMPRVLEEWKRASPGSFRWKAPPGLTRSEGTGPVRTWHNAIEVGKPLASRIEASYEEDITGVVVLIDATRVGKVLLTQATDYIAMVSLSQIDISADLSSVNTILRLFADDATATPPPSLTDWDTAFLNALYRTSYAPAHQRMDITARMSRALAPR